MVTIKVSTDYSGLPHERIMGTEFRDSILIKKYEEAERNNDILEIDFDDCYGVSTVFLEIAFAGMVLKYHKRGILKKIKIISIEDETIPDNIEKYIKIAEQVPLLCDNCSWEDAYYAEKRNYYINENKRNFRPRTSSF